MAEKYTYAVGKRKSASATIRAYNGKGEIIVNEKTLSDYFNNKILEDIVISPLNLLSLTNKYKITIKVQGSGKRGQAEAIKLGIARALVKIDESNRKILKTKSFLTRDPRVKERKKPGLKRARKAPQWSKR